MTEETEKIAVTLSVFEWHQLLTELEYLRRIGNRDRDISIDLWEKIATRLSGVEQIVDGSGKHYKFFPEKYMKPTPPVVEEVKPAAKTSIGFWRRHFPCK